MKSTILIENTINDILSQKYGESGSRFLSIRDYMNINNISYKTAYKIYKYLQNLNYIILINKLWFVCYGICQKGTPLYKYTNNKKLIGIHVKEINNPYITKNIELLKSIYKKHNIQIIIATSENNIDEEKNILNFFVEQGCMGIINFPTTNTELYTFYQNYPLPMVILGRKINNIRIPCVKTDNYQTGRLVAKYLYDCHYKLFYFIGIKDLLDSQNERLKGFMDQLKDYGIILDETNIFRLQQNDDSYLPFITKMFSKIINKDKYANIGVFCINDIFASKLISYITNMHISIPEKIGIIGYDNLPISLMTTPPLSTISYSYTQLAEGSISILENLIENRFSTDDIVINSTMYIRNSTIKLPK